ncbi:hypothetical protein VNI00_013860 [Paramarasmius palmivorus]|uniref:Uncharacterized protein n=1 Tax=Paramarasmius palmivorus TaxID=297713 RepID=A0AAW0C064_9AGAR
MKFSLRNHDAPFHKPSGLGPGYRTLIKASIYLADMPRKVGSISIGSSENHTQVAVQVSFENNQSVTVQYNLNDVVVATAVTAVQSVLIDVANTGSSESTLTKGRFDSDILAPLPRTCLAVGRNATKSTHRISIESCLSSTALPPGNFDLDDHESEDGEAATFDDFEDLTGHEQADGEGDIEVAGLTKVPLRVQPSRV